jgi:hypothetical protein
MKLLEITEKFTVEMPIRYSIGRRGKEFDKNYLKPLVKHVNDELKVLKAKWNGYEYEFKTQELAQKGKKLLDELAIEWNALLKAHPEDEINLDSGIADEYFKHLKKNKLT